MEEALRSQGGGQVGGRRRRCFPDAGRHPEELREVRSTEGHRAAGGARRTHGVPGSVRLRQDDAPAHHRGPGNAGCRHDSPGRPRHLAPPRDAARLRDRVPVLRAVSEPHDSRQRGLRARQSPPGARRHCRTRRGAPEARRAAGCRPQVSRAAVRRAAAAHRARARAGDRARASAARRAALRARRHRARSPARRDPRAAAAPRRHHGDGHARPGGGAVDGRPHRGHERRAHRAGRHAARGLRGARHAVRRGFRRQDQRAAGRGRRRRTHFASVPVVARGGTTGHRRRAPPSSSTCARRKSRSTPASAANGNTLPARIAKVEFLGAFCMVGLALDAAGVPSLVANVPRQDVDAGAHGARTGGDRRPAADAMRVLG